MTTTGWILCSVLLAVIVTSVVLFNKLMIFMLNLHRSERKEYTTATNKVMCELKDAINHANKTTNIFHAQGQIGDKIDKIQTKGDAVMGDQTNE
jgi:hypothetical protein